MSEDTLKEFTKRLEMFQKGFEMITKSISTQLEKIAVQTEKLAANTCFIPKIMESNKETRKTGEKLEMIIDGLINRLDGMSQ
jgi:hypothetical protein